MTAAGTYYGEAYDESIAVPPTRTYASKHTKLTVIMDRCKTATDLGAGTTINLYKPRKGARLIGGTVMNEAHGTGRTLSIGTSVQTYERATDIRDVNYPVKTTPTVADVDRFLAATSIAAAVKTDFPAVGDILAWGYQFDGDTWITATSAGGELVTAKYIAWRLDIMMP